MAEGIEKKSVSWEEIVFKLRLKYNDVHPLIFARSVERAKSPGDLYDILVSLPTQQPVIFSDEKHRWATTNDLTQFSEMQV